MSEPTWSDRKLESEIRALKIECEKRAFELDKAQAENRRLRECTGEQCDVCGRCYHYIYRIPDNAWEQIKPVESSGGGLLCIDCAHARAKQHGITLYFDASEGWWKDNE